MTERDRYQDKNTLFLDGPVEFTKTAMEAHLSDNSDTWVQEVLQELMKQHPYLGQYDVIPKMTQVEGDKGYGFGKFTVSSRTNNPQGPGGAAMAANAGVRSIVIPIIIKDNKLSSFDVFWSKKASPLTEQRVRAEMFRPQLFDSSGSPPGATALSDKLYPPGRSNSGMSAHSSTATPAMKLGSAKPRYLMSAIGETINQTDIDKLTDVLRENMKVASALASNRATRPFMSFLADLTPLQSEQIAKVASQSVQPEVLMLQRIEDDYILKTASSKLFAPEVIQGSRFDMIRLVGEDFVKEAEESGAAVLSASPVVRSVLEEDTVEVITRFGEYRVKTSDGKQMLGWVFPTVVDFDGTTLPMSLFSNGAAAAMQQEIAGSLVGSGTNIIAAKIEGNGFFYKISEDGGVVAFAPGSVKHTFKDPNGMGIVFATVTGEEKVLRPVVGAKRMIPLGANEIAIPADVRWLPFDDSALVKLMEEPEMFKQASEAKNASKLVTIRSDGHTWSFSGYGLSKVASELKDGLLAPDALFLGCTLGLDVPTAFESLAIAGQRGQVKLAGCRRLVSPFEKMAASRKRAKQLWQDIPQRHFLLKEASVLDDATTIDKVLSIGFLNPENISMFISYLPDFELTVSKLAELLIAVRLGLKDVPEIAVKNAMERLDEVTYALKEVMYKASEA